MRAAGGEPHPLGRSPDFRVGRCVQPDKIAHPARGIELAGLDGSRNGGCDIGIEQDGTIGGFQSCGQRPDAYGCGIGRGARCAGMMFARKDCHHQGCEKRRNEEPQGRIGRRKIEKSGPGAHCNRQKQEAEAVVRFRGKGRGDRPPPKRKRINDPACGICRHRRCQARPLPQRGKRCAMFAVQPEGRMCSSCPAGWIGPETLAFCLRHARLA